MTTASNTPNRPPLWRCWRYFLAFEYHGRPARPRSLHVWFGPLGFHWFGKPWVEWFPGWRDSP